MTQPPPAQFDDASRAAVHGALDELLASRTERRPFDHEHAAHAARRYLLVDAAIRAGRRVAT